MNPNTNPAKKSAADEKTVIDFVDDVFCKHPRSVGETYLQHLLFTLYIAFYLVVTALCAVLHGLFPKIFQTTASDRVIAMAADMQERRKKNPACGHDHH